MTRSLIILGIRGVPAAHGGFESFAEQLVPWLVDRGWQVTVYCQGSETGQRHVDTWSGCRRIHIPVKADGEIGTIEFDVKSTFDALREPGLILTLGYNTGFLAGLLRLARLKNVINMDGIEWKRAKYARWQQAYLWCNERLAALCGNHLIADHPEIARHLQRHSPAKKISTIAYGSPPVLTADAAILAEYGLEPHKYLTVIARAVPENSILELVCAFARRPRGVKLVVLGNYSDQNPYQARVLAAGNNEVAFVGAIYDKAKLDALRYFSLAYVHGHQVGGTNPSLVEALGAGNAVIAHDNPFNRWVAGDAARYFTTQDDCARLLDTLLDDQEALTGMRAKANERWAKEFTWPNILEQYRVMLESVADRK
jgi:glycosyltransferase involved in cell wall biosynthesis